VAEALDGHPQRVADGGAEKGADDDVGGNVDHDGEGTSRVGSVIVEGVPKTEDGRSVSRPPLPAFDVCQVEERRIAAALAVLVCLPPSPTFAMTWFAGAWAVFRKDLRVELRSRYAVNSLLLFALGTLLIVAFAIGPQPVSARVRSALLWIVLLFAASIGLGRSFVAEHEGGTALLLRLHTRASMVFAGKLLFNLCLVSLLTLTATAVFMLLIGGAVEPPACSCARWPSAPWA